MRVAKGITHVLKEWFIAFARSKDILARQIESVEENVESWDVIVKEKARTRFVLIRPSLEVWDDILPRLNGDHVTLVVLNTSKNLDAVIVKWAELVKHQKFVIAFANPYSLTDKQWQVYPATHDRITERRVLRKGLEVMAANVERYTEA